MADVTREDAIRFCNAAMRNWQYVSFDESELEDLRIELQRHRTTALAAKEAELAAALAQTLRYRQALIDLCAEVYAGEGSEAFLADMGAVIAMLQCGLEVRDILERNDHEQ